MAEGALNIALTIYKWGKEQNDAMRKVGLTNHCATGFCLVYESIEDYRKDFPHGAEPLVVGVKKKAKMGLTENDMNDFGSLKDV